MNTKERILQYIEFKGLSKREFCLTIGLSNGFLDKVSNIGSDKLEIILSKYPEINPEWLITEKGSMILDSSRVFPKVSIEKENEILDEINKNDALVKKLVRANKKTSQIDHSYQDICIDIDLINDFLGRYSIYSQMTNALNKYHRKQILMKDLVNEFKINFSVVEELYSILEPYKTIINELYERVYDFNDKHDRLYSMDDADIDQTQPEPKL